MQPWHVWPLGTCYHEGHWILSEEMLGFVQATSLVCTVRQHCKTAACCCKFLQDRQGYRPRLTTHHFKVITAVGQAQHWVDQRQCWRHQGDAWPTARRRYKSYMGSSTGQAGGAKAFTHEAVSSLTAAVSLGAKIQ